MIPFIDLKSQQDQIRPKIDKRIQTVLDHGQYILGPEVKELEKNLGVFSNSKYVLCCSSGTDASVPLEQHKTYFELENTPKFFSNSFTSGPSMY